MVNTNRNGKVIGFGLSEMAQCHVAHRKDKSMSTKLTRAQVADRYHVSVRTILRWTDDPDYRDLNFPKSVKLGFRNTLYDLDELEEWEKERATAAPPKVRKKPKATISDLDDRKIGLEAAE